LLQKCAGLLSKAIAHAGRGHEDAEEKLQKTLSSKPIMARRAEGLRWEALNAAYKEFGKTPTDKTGTQDKDTTSVEHADTPQKRVSDQPLSTSPTNVTSVESKSIKYDCDTAAERSVLEQLERAVHAEKAAATTEEERSRAERRGERLKALVTTLDSRAWD